MPDLGDKVGDVYVEVHAELNKGDLAKAEKQLETRALAAQKKLDQKLVRNHKEAIQKANINAIEMEKARIQQMGRLQHQALEMDRKRFAEQRKSIDDLGKLQLQALEMDRKRSEEKQKAIQDLGRLQLQAISEDRARTQAAIREKERLETEALKRKFSRTRNFDEIIARAHDEALREDKVRYEKSLKDRERAWKRHRDGGPATPGQLLENLISILPGQLEKLFRDPKIAAAAIAGGTTLGTFLLAGFGGVIGAGGGITALLGGVALAISASDEFKARGKAMGVDILSGLQESALNQLGPAIEASFAQLEGSNFNARIVGTFNRIFANVKDELVPFVANVDGGLSKILAGFENLSAGASPFIKELGGGINRLGGAVGDLFTKVGDHPELADALNDVFDVTVNLINGFGDLTVNAGQFWQVLKNIKDLDLGAANKGLQARGQQKLDDAKNDSLIKQILTGSWLDKADKDTQDRIKARQGQSEAAVKQSAAVEQQNYNTQRSQALLNDAAKYGSATTAKQAAAFDRAAAEAELYAKEIDDAYKASRNYNDEVSRGLDAQLDWANGLDAVKEQFKGSNDSISLNTKRGRENRAVLLDRLSVARDLAQEEFERTHSADKANAKFKALTDKILENTGATGKNRDAIKEVIGKYKEFQDLPVSPKEIQVKIDAAGLNGVKAQLAALTKSEVKTIFTQVKKKGISESEALSAYRKNANASGGPISGPGSGTSDSIPAMLSNGEFVIKASSARAIGMSTLSRMNSSGRIPTGFATGGSAGNGRGSSAKEKSQYEALLKQISILTKTITAQTKALEAYNNQLSASKEQFKNFVNLGALDTQGKSTGDILTQLMGRKAKTGEFTKNLAALKGKGLSATALQQIAEAGPDSDIAKLVMGGSAYDIGLINSLLGGSSSYAGKVADTIFPNGKGTKAKLTANKKKLAGKQKAAAKLKPVKAKGATISYAGGKTSALFSSKELAQQQLKTGTYVTVVIDGKEVRAIVKEEQKKVATKSNRQMKSGRK